jgi:hypothetical protein
VERCAETIRFWHASIYCFPLTGDGRPPTGYQ